MSAAVRLRECENAACALVDDFLALGVTREELIAILRARIAELEDGYTPAPEPTQ